MKFTLLAGAYSWRW